MEENSRVKRRKMQYPILGRYWAENAEILENKGIPRLSFRFESTSVYNMNYQKDKKILLIGGKKNCGVEKTV